jgi:hypothetical protein
MTSALLTFPAHNSNISFSQKSLPLEVQVSYVFRQVIIYFLCLVIWVGYKLCTSVPVPVPRSQNYTEFGKSQLTLDAECVASSVE